MIGDNKIQFIEKLFQLTSKDLLCNTSYPLNKSWFEKYKADIDIMDGENEMSFYFHIPFCKHLCSFCEYTKFISSGFEEEEKYIELIIKQYNEFWREHGTIELLGLDVGCGTPTALNLKAFEKFMLCLEQVRENHSCKNTIESSMEFSFSTYDRKKILLAAQCGFSRLSAGIQVYDRRMLRQNNREISSIKTIKNICEEIKQCGINKLNLDIMYGLPNESFDVIKNTIDAIELIMPEHVTLYETRYNLNQLDYIGLNRELLWKQYMYIYDRLLSIVYKGRLGQNTFSKYDDEGVSSYLYTRMFYGKPYKGFGISAQSMSRKGLSYNNLKLCKEKCMPQIEKIYEEDIYMLPTREIVAKYVCIALYSGRFNIKVVSDILQQDGMSVFKDEFDFLFNHKYVEIVDDYCILTSKGFPLYGAVASLFWSEEHKEKYIKTVTNNL